MLKLKLQSFGHLMQRADSLERPWCWTKLKAGGEGDDRGWDGCTAPPTWLTWVWASSRPTTDGKGSLACCSPWVSNSWTWLRDWTELKGFGITGCFFPLWNIYIYLKIPNHWSNPSPLQWKVRVLTPGHPRNSLKTQDLIEYKIDIFIIGDQVLIPTITPSPSRTLLSVKEARS